MKSWVRSFSLIALGLLLGGAAGRYEFPDRNGYSARNVVYRVQTNRKAVALTFDDGPSPRWTPTVLRYLQANGAHATFFLIGHDALANKGLVQEELQAGDEIGNHTFRHTDLDSLPPDGIELEIERGADAITLAGAPRPKLFRPPYGDADEIVNVIADAKRYRTIFWGISVEHFVDHLKAEEAVNRIMKRVRPGTIIIAHDGGKADRTLTMRALPLLLRSLRAHGYQVVTVGQLMNEGKPVNHR